MAQLPVVVRVRVAPGALRSALLGFARRGDRPSSVSLEIAPPCHHLTPPRFLNFAGWFAGNQWEFLRTVPAGICFFEPYPGEKFLQKKSVSRPNRKTVSKIRIEPSRNRNRSSGRGEREVARRGTFETH